MDITATNHYSTLFHRQISFALDALLASLRLNVEEGERETAHDSAGRALEILNYALKVPNAWPAIREVLLVLSPKMERDGHWSVWLTFLQAGCDLAQQIFDRDTHAELSMWIGVLYRTLGDYATARRWLVTSTETFQGMGDLYRYARALNRLAWTERLDRNFDQALTIAKMALMHLDQDSTDESLERARSFSILGAIAYDQGKTQEAEHFFRCVLQIPALSLETARLAWGYADLGLVLSAQGKQEEALLHYGSALEILESIHAPIQAAVIKFNLAGIYIALEEPTMALELCIQAYDVLERLNDIRRIIMVETNIGIAYRLRAQNEKSKQMLDSAIQRAEKRGYLYLLINGLHELGLTWLATFDYPEAIAAFQSALIHLKGLEDSPRKEAFDMELSRHLKQAQTAASHAMTIENI